MAMMVIVSPLVSSEHSEKTLFHHCPFGSNTREFWSMICPSPLKVAETFCAQRIVVHPSFVLLHQYSV
jgi:hypothetical protein